MTDERLSLAAEFHLYLSDHAAWCRYIAPRWRELFKNASTEEKRAAWTVASVDLRAELERLKQLEEKTK